LCCDYKPYKEPPRLESNEPEPLVVYDESCLHADLSLRGVNELLQAIEVNLNDSASLISAPNISALVQEFLDLADINLPLALEEFGPCIQQWCPIMHEQYLRGGTNDISQQTSSADLWRSPLLLLGLWLVTRRTCAYREHIERSELYRTMKQVLALLQTQNELYLEAIQLSILVTVYEVGHGLHIQACQTLAGSVALLRMLWLSARKQKDSELVEIAEWLQVSMLMLDR
jgi:hypothetical protein